jgi:hypothetical protein
LIMQPTLSLELSSFGKEVVGSIIKSDSIS